MAEYIEREAARECIHKWLADIFGIDKPELTVLDKRINAIPAADVAPVRNGKWETAFLAHEYLGCRPYAHYCSVCHQIIAFRTFYCPNCGARMDGDGDV